MHLLRCVFPQGSFCKRRGAKVLGLTHRAGLTFSEIRDTPADRDAFFDEYIKPKLPQ